MPYTAQISRQNPTCFLFLLDQSGSMDERVATGEKKSQQVADALNRLLQELTLLCAKQDGIRDYFQVGVLGYGASVGPALGGSLAGRDLVPISELAMNPARVEVRSRKVSDGAGGVMELPTKFPVWVDPVARGATPMSEAMRRAAAILRTWAEFNTRSFPPLVVNLTDGESTDGSPLGPASELRRIQTNDGPALLFNGHFSAQRLSPVTFPETPDGLPDAYATTLFEMSSVLPPLMVQYAAALAYRVGDTSRGMVFNADIVPLVNLLEIGTKATKVLLR